jgi:hypothetical protein
MRLVASFLLVTTVCLFSGGCASILSDKNYAVAVNSSPSGCPVTITNEGGEEVHRAITPFTVVLPASAGFFDGETYKLTSSAATTVLTSSLDPWYVGNLLFGGLVGMLIVDPATGAMWKLPDSVFLGQGIEAVPEPEAAECRE